jgi:anti-sigma regulatory factor (Ser/Thr protein kinase)
MVKFIKKSGNKLILFITAVIIGSSSLYYTNKLVKKLSDEERKKIELWAKASIEIQQVDLDQEISLVVFNIIYENKTIPVILVDDEGNIIGQSNLDSIKSSDENYLKKQLEIMKEQHEPIIIDYYQGRQNFIYYKDSILLTQLFYYPYIQLFVIIIFIFASFYAFKNARKAEENQVWVGMSKETAHQLGTPISSLLAWVEILKMKEEDVTIVSEVEKDVKRLETITERFSKIGSSPILKKIDIIETLKNSILYIKTRSSSQIIYEFNFVNNEIIEIPLNVALFEWVIENICKNAIDAMGSSGKISFSLTENNKQIILDISDSGKGIPKRNFKTIFNPGFTTKKRGWGLGLSLAKRIIEIYHSGKIFVKNSEPGKGTTFRIILNK